MVMSNLGLQQDAILDQRSQQKSLPVCRQRTLLPGQLIFLRKAEIRYSSKNAVLLVLRSRSSLLIPWYNYPTEVVLTRSRRSINRIQKLHDSVWSLLSPPHTVLQVKVCPCCISPQLWQFLKLSMHLLSEALIEQGGSSVCFILLRDKSCGLTNFKTLYLQWI